MGLMGLGAGAGVGVGVAVGVGELNISGKVQLVPMNRDAIKIKEIKRYFIFVLIVFNLVFFYIKL